MSDDELALAVAGSLAPSGGISYRSRFNASLVSSSQFDSLTGWAHVLTSGLAFPVNRYLSADVAMPIFLYLQSQRSIDINLAGQQPTTFTRATVRRGVPSDTVMAVHFTARHFALAKVGSFGNTVTASLTAPTGSTKEGVGAGRVTYNFTDHLQSDAPLSPYFDLGVGTTSQLQNQRLQRSQTSHGTLLNMGAGVSLNLPRASKVYLEGYEQFPLGSQAVFQSGSRTAGAAEYPMQTSGSGLAEDNGVNLSVDIPVAPHVMWSGFYARGFRLHEDTAGFGFTFLLRSPSRASTTR